MYYHKYKGEKGIIWANKQREWKDINREHSRELYRNWCKANYERAKAIAHRRRARKMNAQGTHTAEDIKIQYRRQKGRCYWCAQKFSKSKTERATMGYHVDHYIPLSRGGTNNPDNIVLACPFCNTSRKDRLPNEWKGANRLF
jgi:5-methylcytosine-specific restriction endonuclease McrA